MLLTYRNVDALCAGVDLGQERPEINLSEVIFIEPFAVIYLGQFIRYHNSQGIFFRLIQPKLASVNNYLNRIQFWKRFQFSREETEKAGLFKFASPSSLNDIVELGRGAYIADDAVELVRSMLDGAGIAIDHGAVLEIVAELADNFDQHAGVELATMAVQYYKSHNELVIAIGDCGLGIRNTLCDNPAYNYLRERSHCEAIIEAFKPMVSRKTYAGMGLVAVKEAVTKQGGSIRVASCDGFVYISGNDAIMTVQKYNLPGVQIEACIPERQNKRL